MLVDADNPVVQLCAAGMAIEGDAPAARALFEQAWELRRDDYDACIAAHFLARHQTSPEATLHWNKLAVQHAEAVTDGRASGFLASLYLNLGDAYRVAGERAGAATASAQARAALVFVPDGGYRDFVARAIDRLDERLASSCEQTTLSSHG